MSNQLNSQQNTKPQNEEVQRKKKYKSKKIVSKLTDSKHLTEERNSSQDNAVELPRKPKKNAKKKVASFKSELNDPRKKTSKSSAYLQESAEKEVKKRNLEMASKKHE